MALEVQRDDIARTANVELCNTKIDAAYSHAIDLKNSLDWAMRHMSDQNERTIVSTAYDITTQVQALIEQLAHLRSFALSER
jgi:hypothetical protein